MNKFLPYLLDANLRPDWVVASFPIIRIVLVILMAICALVLIVAILMQSHSANDITAISGQESYYSQNKGETKDGRLKKITIAMASIIAIVVILYFVTCLIYPAV